MSGAVRLPLAEAEALVARALRQSRTGERQAASVARALVAAEADGQAGHGLMRVASYAAQAASGKVDGFAEPSLERPRPGWVAVDAGLGFAYPALDLARGALEAAARAQGVAMAAVSRSHHCGALGLQVEWLAEQGLVALMLANTPKSMAPWGGKRPLFGTNPIAFAAPMPDGPPLVIDLSLTVVARGKIVAAQKAGRPIPEGWAVDPQGRPTTDPAAAIAGTLLPAGGAKGAALALMVEVLAGALAGPALSAETEATAFFEAEGPPPGLGQTLLAIDPQAAPGYAERMGRLAAAIAAEEGARLPGTRRLGARAEAAAEGLAVAPERMAELRGVAGD